MTWWRRRHARISDAEAEEARVARQVSESALSNARDSYRATLQLAAVAKKANTRNHFSERLNEAFGG